MATGNGCIPKPRSIEHALHAEVACGTGYIAKCVKGPNLAAAHVVCVLHFDKRRGRVVMIIVVIGRANIGACETPLWHK